jgi:RimJ/RimL family protein N-acetyltransferase
MAPEQDSEWLTSRTGVGVTPKFRALEAIDADGRIRGMVGYDNWRPNSVEMHVVLESVAAARPLLRFAFDYAFNHAKKAVAFGLTPASNTRAIRLAKHLGFQTVGRIPDGWEKGADLVVFAMRREDCRWLKGAST